MWGGLNPNLVSALAPFGLDRAGAEIGAEIDNYSKELTFDTHITWVKITFFSTNEQNLTVTWKS